MATESRWLVAVAALEDAPKQVRLYRRVLGLSLRDAAEEIGMSFTALHRFERGQSVVARQLPAILRWIDVNRDRVGIVVDEVNRDV